MAATNVSYIACLLSLVIRNAKIHLSTTLCIVIFFSPQWTRCSPIRGIARDVRSDLVLLSRPNIGIHGQAESNVDIKDADLPSGQALDLFYRYGFYSLSVRVVPRDDPGSWLIREPTASIFQANSVQRRSSKGTNTFDPQFQIFFCDDVAELMEAYFRDFTAEGIEQPSKLYTGSWHTSTKSKYFGLNKSIFSDGESQYVLVKLSKTNWSVQVDRPPQLKPEAHNAATNIQVGNPESVLSFVRTYGSHYIQAVVVGDVIYQVFALENDQYARAKSAMQGSDRISRDQFKLFYNDHLAPWQVRETGSIKVASGDLMLKRWVENNLIIEGKFGSYPNIFSLLDNSRAVQDVEDLSRDTSAVIGLHFASLRSWIPDIQAREYYDEIVDTQATLWEANI